MSEVQSYRIPYIAEPGARWYEEDEHIPQIEFACLDVSPEEHAALKRGDVTLAQLIKESRQ